ncbi:MAG: hypothetical protein D6704_09485 [Nitrospirae bacterium]|nr:MAG: hypothetical protein D6704_09485 [Nitrospirota bacterium]
MATKELLLNLGKLIIGIAWLDGELQTQELNILKEVLFQLPDLTGDDWTQLELYMVHPVSDQERETLFARVLESIRSPADKAFVLETLRKVIAADGTVSAEEAAALAAMEQDLDRHSSRGLFSHLIIPLRRILSQGQRRHRESREDRLEDFIKNTIYFRLVTELRARGTTIELPDDQIKKLCLAAGLMAHVAWIDREFCDREHEAMVTALRTNWGLPPSHAHLLVELSRASILRGLDLVRLTKGFQTYSTPDERKAFLRTLFAIANASHKTSFEEIEAIRAIAKAFDLSHQDFIEAKLTISRTDRHGL